MAITIILSQPKCHFSIKGKERRQKNKLVSSSVVRKKVKSEFVRIPFHKTKNKIMKENHGYTWKLICKHPGQKTTIS